MERALVHDEKNLNNFYIKLSFYSVQSGQQSVLAVEAVLVVQTYEVY